MCVRFDVPFYLRLQAVMWKINMSVCGESKHTGPKPTAMSFSRLSPQEHFEGFLSLWQGEAVLQGVAVHSEPLLTLAQWALCHLLNQKSWSQVANRSQSHHDVRQKQWMCTLHALPPKEDQSPAVSGLPTPHPLHPSAHYTTITTVRGQSLFLLPLTNQSVTLVSVASGARAGQSSFRVISKQCWTQR